MTYRREISLELESRLKEPRRFIQIVAGPRQTGKTTAVKQALDSLNSLDALNSLDSQKIPSVVVNADRLSEYPQARIQIEWEQAREMAQQHGEAILFIDEIQKVDSWSDIVKNLWDEDSWNELPLKVVLSGSSTLLLSKTL